MHCIDCGAQTFGPYCSHCGARLGAGAAVPVLSTPGRYPLPSTHGSYQLPEVSGGVVAGAYVVGAFIPVLGWIMAIYLLVKNKAGHAMGVGALSLLMFCVWLGVVSTTSRGGARWLAPQPGPGGVAGADPAATRLVGTWQCQSAPYGIPTITTTTLRADGTYASTAQAAGGSIITDAGRWSYQNGIITSTSPLLGIEQESITWHSANEVHWTCLSCTGVPEAVGMTGISTRVR